MEGEMRKRGSGRKRGRGREGRIISDGEGEGVRQTRERVTGK